MSASACEVTSFALRPSGASFFHHTEGATTTPGRYSLTYQKRGGKWLIVDHQAAIPR